MTAKVCLVTGSSYGLGSDIAKQLSRSGWQVILVARSEDKLAKVKADIEAGGGVAESMPCDITNKASVAALKEVVDDKYPGGVDCVINNAAYVPPLHNFVTGDVEEWEKCVGVNVWGALNITRYHNSNKCKYSPFLIFRTFLPSMVQNKRGQIFFISSKAGVTPSAGLAVHSGTKHMVEALAKSLRLELKGSGVGVGVIRPGGINTPGNDLTLGFQTSDSDLAKVV